MLEKLTIKMIEYFRGDPKRIQHFIKVRSFARAIAIGENVGEDALFIIETAALVHDIGIKRAEAEYGECGGKLQEQLGPPEALKMLDELGFPELVTERVCYLVSKHHTYTNIDVRDHQILIEADFIVNLYEDGESEEAVRTALDRIFKTETGKKLCSDVFGID